MRLMVKRFNQKLGLRSADADFDPRMDLDSDGAIGFSDFLMFWFWLPILFLTNLHCYQ